MPIVEVIAAGLSILASVTSMIKDGRASAPPEARREIDSSIDDVQLRVADLERKVAEGQRDTELASEYNKLLSASAASEVVLSPYILALQIAPKVAFAPLFVMWFGYTVYPKILVAVLIVFFPIMVNVLTAIRTVDHDLINLARSFTASRLQVFWKIEFRSAMPALFSGLRIGSTLAVIGVVVGELVGGNTGLGYLLSYGEGAANTPMVFVTIILLTLVGIVAYLAVVWLEARVLHYLPKRHIAPEGI